MTLKEQLILELENTPEPMIEEVLHFIRRLKIAAGENLEQRRTIETKKSSPFLKVKRGNLVRLRGVAQNHQTVQEGYVDYLIEKYC